MCRKLKMSGRIETDLTKIVQKERKEAVIHVMIGVGFATGIIGLGYAFSPNYYKQELQEHYLYCTNLANKASGNVEITQFVYDTVTIPEGFHAGKTCRQVIEEYRARER